MLLEPWEFSSGSNFIFPPKSVFFGGGGET